MKFKIDKTDWKPVKLSDVVTKKEDNDKENAKNRFDRFLKVDHMDAESLHIKRWASQEAGDEINPTFYKIFRKGQMLFPTRNPHLRRTALASFDGICGEKTLTLEAIEEMILPEFLPFLFHSDSFYDHTTSAIVGSTNPHCRWRDVANYEFRLPPKEQQLKLADLLWSMDEVIEKEKKALKLYKQFTERFLVDTVSGASSNTSNWKIYTFGELGESFGGLTGKSKKDFGAGFPFITYMNVFKNTKVCKETFDLVKISDGENQKALKYGDILITGSSETPEEVGMTSVVLDELENYYLNSFCFGFRLNDFEVLTPEYARFLLRGREVRRFMHKNAQGSTRFNISKTTIKNKLQLLLPNVEVQKTFTIALQNNEERIKLFSDKLSKSKVLHKSLINKVF